MNISTTFDLDKHLAIQQMVHYLHLQQSAIAVGDHNEIRRATQQLDRLASEYGVQALNEAQDDCHG
ncbi:hypothetical protein [Pseudomonas ogarae]|uniref:hypothetical protein n=1 Tax=Pseudomonas ogarae (strain DSM 112162 / CECT 30235 / F113) TaxID=1114970 RepID=UPI0011432EC5|nr:hypothetical protein [Pseudomonas ogarae]